MTAFKLVTIVAFEVLAASFIAPRSAIPQANPAVPLVPLARYCVLYDFGIRSLDRRTIPSSWAANWKRLT
jgi:hypothetical protein